MRCSYTPSIYPSQVAQRVKIIKAAAHKKGKNWYALIDSEEKEPDIKTVIDICTGVLRWIRNSRGCGRKFRVKYTGVGIEYSIFRRNTWSTIPSWICLHRFFVEDQESFFFVVAEAIFFDMSKNCVSYKIVTCTDKYYSLYWFSVSISLLDESIFQLKF